MKKHKIIALSLIAAFILIPLVASAALTIKKTSFSTKPIGGMVLTTPETTSAAIVCNATYGPFTAKPVNPAVPGPFFIQNTKNGTPKKGGHFLALYNSIPDMKTCYNPETGVPIPAFKITLYGVSR